jgi:hypothetical protein
VLDPAGRCETRADCRHGLDCLQGVCAACRGDFDCSGWESCGGDGLCAPLAGRCDADADCASWDGCDASHTCALRADHCPNVACATLERCDPEHHCTLQAGRCLADVDCVAWTPTCDVPTNSCKFGAVAGDDLLAWGTLAEGRDDRIAVARVSAPTKVEVGFDAGSAFDGRAFVDPITGELVYRHTGDAGGDTLRRFNRDAIVFDPVTGRWTYPTAPSADDEIAIDAAACPMTWVRWVMQGAVGTETGPRALLYGCPHADSPLDNPLWDFFGAASVAAPGLQGIQAALSWSANGYVLVRDADGAYQVVSQVVIPVGEPKAVIGLPAGAHFAYRTYATGFRVALQNGSNDELWEIAEATAAAAPYAPAPNTFASVPGAYKGVAWEVLDSAGNMYSRAYFVSTELILKRPLLPGTVSEVYTEADPAASNANDFAATTFKPFLRLNRSFLVTRP